MFKPSMSSGMRLIPARAGNTTHTHILTLTRAAHPRSRGEHVVADTSQGAAVGSSPLARGTPSFWNGGRGRGRLIPARAGNTTYAYPVDGVEAAHPRSRGEHNA